MGDFFISGGFGGRPRRRRGEDLVHPLKYVLMPRNWPLLPWEPCRLYIISVWHLVLANGY